MAEVPDVPFRLPSEVGGEDRNVLGDVLVGVDGPDDTREEGEGRLEEK